MQTQQNESWHLDKRVPIALILAIAVQTATAIWWAAALDSRVTFAESEIIKQGTALEVQRTAVGAQAVQLGRIEEQIGGLRVDIGRLLTAMERGRP